MPVGGIFTGESGSTLADEIEFRMRRLEMEAANERAAGPRDGVRRQVAVVDSALMALRRLHVRQHLPVHHGHHA